MQNSHSNMDHVFRETLKNHEVEVSPTIWGVLEDELLSKYNTFPKRFRYLSYVAVATLLLSIGLTVVASQKYFNYIQLSQQIEIEPDSHLLKYYNHITEQQYASPQIITKEVEVIKKIYETVEVPVEVTKYVSNVNFADLKNLLSQYRDMASSDEELARLDAKLHLIQKYGDGSIIEPETDNSINGLTSIDLKELLNYGINENLIAAGAEKDVFTSEANNLGMALDGSGTYGHNTETTTQQLIDNILKDKVVDIEGLQVGGGATFFNSWILNKSISKVSPNMLHYPLTLGMQYDFILGYNINSKIGIETGLSKANQGQRYIQYIDTEPHETEIRLDYLHIPFVFKYKWEQYSSITKNAIVRNYLFGLQYSRLLATDGTFNEDIVALADIERMHDLGFIVGVDHDIFLNTHYFLTFGIRSTFSSDLDSLIDSFNSTSGTKTDNFTVGLKASFNYLFNAN